MPQDAFRVLADTVTTFVDNWLRIVDGRTWLDGSEAQTECAGDTFADEWGKRPCRDAWIAAHTTANAGLDHLRALAVLMPADGIVLPLSTTARGALEAFASAHYLTAPDVVDGRERVRRYMNTRLASLYDSRRQIPANGSDTDLQGARDHIKERIRRVTDSARRQGFSVHHTKRGIPYLDHEQPTVTRLCDEAVSDTPRLGALYYSQLSAVAHARAHGLTAHAHMVSRTPNAETGDGLAAVTITAPQAALNLLGAPVAAVNVAQRLLPACGWDLENIRNSAHGMLSVWGRIGGVPYPKDASQEGY